MLVLWPVNDKVYIHEFIDIIGHNRANYMHHMTANFSPMAQEDRNQLLLRRVGRRRHDARVARGAQPLGGATASTASPRRSASSSVTRPSQDPKLAKWWAEASNYRRHGDDRVLVPAPWTPTITELVAAGVQGETLRARADPRAAWAPSRDFLEVVAEEAIAGLRGVRLEARAARGRPRWSTSRSASCIGRSPRGRAGPRPSTPSARDSALQRWRKRTYELSEQWHRFLVVDAPLSPMRIGRQPARDDRDEGWQDL